MWGGRRERTGIAAYSEEAAEVHCGGGIVQSLNVLAFNEGEDTLCGCPGGWSKSHQG